MAASAHRHTRPRAAFSGSKALIAAYDVPGGYTCYLDNGKAYKADYTKSGIGNKGNLTLFLFNLDKQGIKKGIYSVYLMNGGGTKMPLVPAIEIAGKKNSKYGPITIDYPSGDPVDPTQAYGTYCNTDLLAYGTKDTNTDLKSMNPATMTSAKGASTPADSTYPPAGTADDFWYAQWNQITYADGDNPFTLKVEDASANSATLGVVVDSGVC